MSLTNHGTAYAITLLLLFAACLLVPSMRRFILELLDRVGDATLRAKSGVASLIEQHRRQFAYGTLACAAAGLFVALPNLMHNGYFASAPAAGSSAEAESSMSVARSPGEAPSLEYQIDVADCIVLAETHVDKDVASYELQDFWKAPEDCTRAAGSPALIPDISSFRQLGYSPKQGQQVVLFFTPGRNDAPQLFELLPVARGRVTYAPGDSSAEQQLDLDALRHLVTGSTKAAN